MMAAVSAEPVNDTTSNGSSWSINPAELPQMTEMEPAGKIPASTTSLTMRWVNQAVVVAGLTMTGTPDNRAGAAFSHKPHEGKLKALMNKATPRVGVHVLRLKQDVFGQSSGLAVVQKMHIAQTLAHLGVGAQGVNATVHVHRGVVFHGTAVGGGDVVVGIAVGLQDFRGGA